MKLKAEKLTGKLNNEAKRIGFGNCKITIIAINAEGRFTNDSRPLP